MDKTLLYVAKDGSYGDATDLLLVDATDFTSDDYESLDGVDDGYRREEAAEIAVYRIADPLRWAWMTEDEAHQIVGTIEAAIAVAMSHGQMGLAEELGDVRDVLRRTSLTF